MEMRGSKEAKLGRMIFDGPFRCHEERRGYVTVQASRGKEGNLLFFFRPFRCDGKRGFIFREGWWTRTAEQIVEASCFDRTVVRGRRGTRLGERVD